MANACKGRERCARCSAVGHNSSACESSKPRCSCGGEHEAWSRECPRLEADGKKVKERVAETAKRTPTETHPTNRPKRHPDPAAPSGQQPQPVPESTAYRDALVGENLSPQVSKSRSPPPVITLETKIQDCMQLSLQQFLALLSDQCRAIQPSKDKSTLTRDIVVQRPVGMNRTTPQPPETPSSTKRARALHRVRAHLWPRVRIRRSARISREQTKVSQRLCLPTTQELREK